MTGALAVALVLAGCAEKKAAPLELELLRALPVEGPYDLQPSGLAVREGILHAVSDKHPSTVFAVHLEADVARFSPAIEFAPPDGISESLNLDLEGLSLDDADRFILASEAINRVLTVNDDGSSEWITPEVMTDGRRAGLFAVDGGGLEGLVRLGDHDFLLAAERQYRGLIRVSTRTDPPAIDAWQMEGPGERWPTGRSPDFAGLCEWRGRVFALERNRHTITELIPDNARFRLGPSWSFAAAENNPSLQYSDRRFGLAEGLVLTDREIFVILDNNGDARANNAADRRPILFIFRNPLAGDPGR